MRKTTGRILPLLAALALTGVLVGRLSEPPVAAQRAAPPRATPPRAAPPTTAPATTQPARQSDSPAGLETPASEHLLAGPKVSDEDELGTGPVSFAGRRGRPPLRVRPGEWFALLEELDLERSQRAEVQAIVGGYRAAVRRFRRAHGEDLDELRRQFRRMRQAGETPSPQLRQRIQQIMSRAPKPPAYQQQVWVLLTPTQQEELRRRLAARREAIARRQAEQSSRQRDVMDGPRRQNRRPPENDRRKPDSTERDR